MYKFRLFTIIATTAIFLACEKDSSVHLQKGLTIEAKQVSTRTSFNGNKTSWVTGDEMKVMVGEDDAAPNATYNFTCENGDTGRFCNGEILSNPETAYDFYAVYPATATTELNNIVAKIAIGAETQTQNGTDPNHIAALDPLTGYAKGLYPDKVSIPMSHNAAVLVVSIANDLGQELAGIKSLTITADNRIALCGKYDIDIVNGTLSNVTDTSSSVTVEVTNSGKISSNGEFKVYAAIAPCILPNNATLKFTVTDTNNTSYELTKAFPDGRTIVASDLLSTTVRLAEAEAITYNADFTIEQGGIPTSLTEEENTYIYNGKEIGFYNANGYKYDTTNKYILFQSVGNRDNLSAKIYIPQIGGYELSSLTIFGEEPVNQKVLNFSLVNNTTLVSMKDALGGTSDSKYISSSSVKADLYTPSNVTYIKIFSDNNNQGRNYKCKGLSLRYVKSE